uniref:UDP-N-acetylglucosamine transferase subunit ALG13 n=1 Tax=Latimeria chalumnae TaxID=7897 RepID=H2ZV02_LATCH
MPYVFVTVGTTSFDELISAVSAEETIQLFQKLGYRKLVLQIGRGTVEPKPYTTAGFALQVFRYKDSIAEDIRNAALVISHAGEWPAFDSVENSLRSVHLVQSDYSKLTEFHLMCVFVFTKLHSIFFFLSTLAETLERMDPAALKPFPPGQPENFAAFLNKALGISE